MITNLQSFLLELGNGFSFVARQKRILLEDDEFFIDLVFYNRLLRCFVIIEIKTHKITHADVGQLQMYVNYYDRYEKQTYEKTMVDALNSIAPLMESAITTTNQYAMERLTFSKKSLSEAIFYSASFLTISIALFLYIKVKVSFRIKALSKTMSELSNENDQDVPYSSD